MVCSVQEVGLMADEKKTPGPISGGDHSAQQQAARNALLLEMAARGDPDAMAMVREQSKGGKS